MIRRTLLSTLMAGVALASLAGCGRQSAEHQPSAATPPSASLAPPAAGSPQSAAAQKASKAARLNEDGSETVEETAGDSGAHNPLLAAVASTVTAGSAAAHAGVLTGPTAWQEGVNYTRLVPAQPTAVPAGQVEVLEFFWYACPHCYALEPDVAKWLKRNAAYVTFTRVPVMWNQGQRSLAQLFYTVQAIGKLDQLHDAIFKEIHVSGNPLIGNDPENAGDAERTQVAFVRRFGIAENDFRQAYMSMAVNTAMQRADELVERYRITAVPSFVVNGKFGADVSTAGSPEKLLTLLDDLAAAEHKP